MSAARSQSKMKVEADEANLVRARLVFLFNLNFPLQLRSCASHG